MAEKDIELVTLISKAVDGHYMPGFYKNWNILCHFLEHEQITSFLSDFWEQHAPELSLVLKGIGTYPDYKGKLDNRAIVFWLFWLAVPSLLSIQNPLNRHFIKRLVLPRFKSLGIQPGRYLRQR